MSEKQKVMEQVKVEAIIRRTVQASSFDSRDTQFWDVDKAAAKIHALYAPLIEKAKYKLPTPGSKEYQELRKRVIDNLNSWHLAGRQAVGQLGEVADSVLALLGGKE